jgi:hypothetical protein
LRGKIKPSLNLKILRSFESKNESVKGKKLPGKKKEIGGREWELNPPGTFNAPHRV